MNESCTFNDLLFALEILTMDIKCDIGLRLRLEFVPTQAIFNFGNKICIGNNISINEEIDQAISCFN